MESMKSAVQAKRKLLQENLEVLQNQLLNADEALSRVAQQTYAALIDHHILVTGAPAALTSVLRLR